MALMVNMRSEKSMTGDMKEEEEQKKRRNTD